MTHSEKAREPVRLKHTRSRGLSNYPANVTAVIFKQQHNYTPFRFKDTQHTKAPCEGTRNPAGVCVPRAACVPPVCSAGRACPPVCLPAVKSHLFLGVWLCGRGGRVRPSLRELKSSFCICAQGTHTLREQEVFSWEQIFRCGPDTPPTAGPMLGRRSPPLP